jgi:hypothetical protein
MRFKIFFSCLAIVFLCFFTHSQVTFNFTGSVQTWTVPAGVTSVNLTVAGAKGGGVNGGNGAVITKNCFTVTPGQVLNIYVGGMGVVQVTQQQQLHIDHGVEAVPLIFELEELLLLTES